MKPIILTLKQLQDIERHRKDTLDRRIYQRLTAILAVAAGNTREEVADLLGMGRTQLGEWLRIFRNNGVDALTALHYQGDPGNLTPNQVLQLKDKVRTGCFRNSDQIRHWLAETFHVTYSSSGVKDLLKRLGISYHKVTGFLWKADPDKQKAFVKKYRQQKAWAKRPRAPGPGGISWMPVIPFGDWTWSFPAGCWWGSGRKRLNILGAYCPDDQEYLDLRLTRDNINGEQFVNLLRLLRAQHPETERFLLYLDRAKYYSKPVVYEWLQRHPEFHLEPLPTYSPNLNLIERLWKFLRRKALSRWHPTFTAMQAAVAEVLDHLEQYRDELSTLLAEKFHIITKAEIPVQYREVGKDRQGVSASEATV